MGQKILGHGVPALKSKYSKKISRYTGCVNINTYTVAGKHLQRDNGGRKKLMDAFATSCMVPFGMIRQVSE